MQVTKENLKRELDQFNNKELNLVAEFIEFIKFRSQSHQEFAEEDRELAEAGIADYAAQLQQEDQ
jgi:hypothetical protein